ncbi:MAG: sigma-70 family RNA polymerase sigma factor [Planctomycetes bacterium]|nr:sigma-70 family RNA polymerase sigma factor [Planctomycetota bacterium]
MELVRERLVRCRLPVSPERMAEILERVAGADLYLAIACEEGIEGAWRVFEARFVPRVKGLALRHGASESQAEELARELPGHLVAPPRGGRARTRMGTYNGAVPLFDWLAVIVVQRLADRRRARARAPSGEASAALEAASADGDPAEAVLDAETAGKLEEALRAAWERLTAREAAALLLKFKDGLPQKEIATLFGVGEPQVSKILRSAVDKIRSEVESRLRDQFPGRWADRDGAWVALRNAVGRHMERIRPPIGFPSKGSSPHGPRAT